MGYKITEKKLNTKCLEMLDMVKFNIFQDEKIMANIDSVDMSMKCEEYILINLYCRNKNSR